MDSNPDSARHRLCDALRRLFNPIHWAMLDRLAERPQSVEDLARDVPRTRTVVSKSLGSLAALGVVSFAVEKKEHVYRIRSDCVEIDTEALHLRCQIDKHCSIEVRIARQPSSADPHRQGV